MAARVEVALTRAYFESRTGSEATVLAYLAAATLVAALDAQQARDGVISASTRRQSASPIGCKVSRAFCYSGPAKAGLVMNV